MVATLIVDNERISGEFSMFDVRSLDETSAVLEGPLFLEVGELLTLRFEGKEKGAKAVALEVRVHSVVPEEESMTVHFIEPQSQLKLG